MTKQSFLSRIFYFLVILCLFQPAAFAKNITFEATVDRNKVALGDVVQLSLIFNGTQNAPAPDLQIPDGFQGRYAGPSTNISIINGQTALSITHRYILIPLKIGSFSMGPISINYDNQPYTAPAIPIEVTNETSSQNTTTQTLSSRQETTQQESANLNDRIFLTINTDKQIIYLNEIMPLTVKLYVNRFAVRDVETPQLNTEGFSGDSFKGQQYQQALNGVLYDVVEYRTNFFATRAGEFKFGPARLKCTLLAPKKRERSGSDNFFDQDFFDNFFGGYEAYPLNLKSPELNISVLLLPEEEKPANFSGTVGDFTFNMSASPNKVKLGDPITLKMKIEGRGNFNSVHCPKLLDENGFKIYDPQEKLTETDKSFEQIIMPQKSDIKQIPQINFNFFNPTFKKYQTITAGPFPIEVIKPDATEQSRIIETTLKQEEVFGQDILYIKELPGKLYTKGEIYIYQHKYFWMFWILPPLFYLFVYLWRRRYEKLKTDTRYARRLHAPRKARNSIALAKKLIETEKTKEFYTLIFKIIQEYLGGKLHLTSGSITEEITTEILKPKNINNVVLDNLNRIFTDCDMARYAPSQFNKEKMEEIFNKLVETIDYFEKNKL